MLTYECSRLLDGAVLLDMHRPGQAMLEAVGHCFNEATLAAQAAGLEPRDAEVIFTVTVREKK